MNHRVRTCVVARWLTVLIAVIVLSGCGGTPSFTGGGGSGGGNGSGGQGPGPDAGPIQTPGPKTGFFAVVEFADTGFPMAAVVTVGSELVATEPGQFTVPLQPGTYSYNVVTLLGTLSGAAQFDEDGVNKIIFPAFEDWSAEIYNRMLAHTDPFQGRFYTRRWERGKTIKIWVQPAANPFPTEAQRDLAFEAVGEWMDLLDGAISYEYVDNENGAEITIKWVELSELPSARGRCRVQNFSGSGYIFHADMIIREDRVEIPTYLHEFGHCLGFEHSNNLQHIMYEGGVVVSEISEVEKNLIRLLYAIPARSPALSMS